MRLINTLILTILWVLNSNAQEFGTHWISYPLPNDSSEVWFRKSYKFSSQPIQAFLSIASTGNYKLYINERNVTGSLLFEGQKEDIMENHTLDVTRYLKSGNNVIAIWYAPMGEPSFGKQISAELYGWRQDSIPFYYPSNGSWLTYQPQGCSHGEDEQFDGRTDVLSWKSTDDFHSQGWIHPTGSYGLDQMLTSQENRVFKSENKLRQVLSPVYQHSDSAGYHIDFGRPFRGTIRLTLRNAHKGDNLFINGYQYTCNGELDEQAFLRFKFQSERIYTLTWSSRFKKSYIVNVEGLEIEE